MYRSSGKPDRANCRAVYAGMRIMVAGPMSWHEFEVDRIGGMWLRCFGGYSFNII